jgi:hypothetical protein
MEVFQPGDNLRFVLKSAHKIWLAGETGEDNFHSNFAPNRTLRRSIDRPEPARPYPLAQFIALDDLSAEIVHRRIYE